MKKNNIYKLLPVIGMYFLVISAGFFIVLMITNFMLSLFDNLIDSKLIVRIIEYVLAWPFIICAMLVLFKWVEKKYAKLEIKPFILAIIPTVEALIFYGFLFLYTFSIPKSGKLAFSILYIIGVFIIIYAINLFLNFINKKKQ